MDLQISVLDVRNNGTPVLVGNGTCTVLVLIIWILLLVSPTNRTDLVFYAVGVVKEITFLTFAAVDFIADLVGAAGFGAGA